MKTIGVLLAGLVLVLGGCSQPVGGHYCDLEMRSVPDGQPAYLILYDDWIKAGGTAMLNDAAAMANHRVGTTPVEKKNVPSWRHVYVAGEPGRFSAPQEFVGKAGHHVLTAEIR